jgi:hypothetical protein
MNERVVYNSEDIKWYPEGDAPWKVRVVARGEQLKPLRFAIADTYADAFLALFGTEPLIPEIKRTPRREVFV